MYRNTAVTFEVLMAQGNVSAAQHVTTYSLGSTGEPHNKHRASYRERWDSFFQENSIKFYRSAGFS
jgi:hypothetical protein